MNNRFRMPTNLSLRLLALLFAICLWFLASDDNQISWLEAEERVISIDVTASGIASGLVLTTTPPAVEVRLNVPKGTDLEDLTANVDLSGKKAGEHRVLVNVPAPLRSTIISIEPPYLQLRLERSVSAKFNIEVAALGLNNLSSLPVDAFTSKPGAVVFTGAESRMAQVDRAVVTVEYKPGGGEVSAQVRAVDSAGNDVPWIKATPSTVTVAIKPAAQNGDNATIGEDTNGNPATNESSLSQS